MKIWRIAQSPKEIAVATIVVNNGKVLILKRGQTAPWMPNKWNLPGGGVEEGESLEYAALRECQEETGLKIHNLVLFRSFDDVDFLLKVFTAETSETDGDRINLNFENSDYMWVDKTNYQTYDYVPYIKVCIASVLSR